MIVAAFCTLWLPGCSEVSPTGQVIAVVDGEEVTAGELRAEADARNVADLNDPATRSELVGALVDRKLWVGEAKRRKLDRQVEFVLARRRAEEALLAGFLTRELKRFTEPPNNDEVDRYLRTNPTAFSNRTIFQIDQITIRREESRPLAADLDKARSLDEVGRMLNVAGVVGQRSRTEWNSLFMPASLAARLRRSGPGRLFIHQEPGVTVFGTVLAQANTSVSHNDREALVREMLRRANVDTAVDKRLGELRASAPIRFQPGFELDRRGSN
jgi:EpsD family peptidyl-prolyl cis-trans isomerase